uniref:Amino acid transporter transmembrane domain-containing protein n=1 Tax=Aegilops tauschii TaxID=37682 RepID=M8BWH3_AEGTA
MAFGEGGGDATAPLISSDGPKRHLNIVRNGNEWTASAHVITAVIGSGVLSLAWSMAQLGWVAGPGMMVVFASVTALQSTIFADCYRSPDPEHGPHRNRTYAHAVERNLEQEQDSWLCLAGLASNNGKVVVVRLSSARHETSLAANVHCRVGVAQLFDCDPNP